MNAATSGEAEDALQAITDRRLPIGFAGSATSPESLLGAQGPILRLPQDGERDGPFVRIPRGPHAAILIDALAESLGNVEGLMRAAAAALSEDGQLVVDAENQQSMRELRTVVEGRTNGLEPYGSVRDPERPVALRRLLKAIVGAGLLIEDVVRVPSMVGEVSPTLAKSLFAEGFVPVSFLPEPPPARHWIRCRRTTVRAGTVLVGAGPAGQQERTAGAVRAFLPADWEVRIGDGDDERSSFRAMTAASCGEVLWMLRAGAVPSAEVFAQLLAQTVLGPASPRTAPAGDVSGTMLSRVDLMQVGPVASAFACDAVAYEDFGMRLDALSLSVTQVAGAFTTPPARSGGADRLGAETELLVRRWEQIHSELGRHRSEDDPRARQHANRDVPWRGRNPRISLCMIAKNEERFLAECLRRAAPCVDEIVLVDTGSTDATVAIAERFGAKVLHEPWCDDFSHPRNVGIDAATGDWILVLDADEQLQEGAAGRMREIVEDAGVAGYHLAFKNVYDGGKTLGVVMVRLFRKLDGARFVNRIHEQITPGLLAVGAKDGLILSMTELEVLHYGYQDAVMTDKRKNERNERLFRMQLEEHPDDVYSLYKYGDFLRRIPGRGDDALATLQACLDRIEAMPPAAPREIPYAAEVAALCALEHARRDRAELASAIVERALRRMIPTPNLHYIAASLAVHARRDDEAIAHYERCLAYRGQTLVVPIQEGVTSYVSLTGIAQAFAQKGDRAKARRLLDQATTICPDYDVAALTLSRLHCEDGDFGRALTVLTTFLTRNPDSAGACQQAALILLRLGMSERARAMGDRAARLLREQCLDHEANRIEATLAGVR